MKRFLVLLVGVGLIIFLVSGIAFAQDQQNDDQQDKDKKMEVADLFSWLTGDSPNWKVGIWYAVMGVIGALVTVFGLIGGAIPGTAGYARIDANFKRVEEREKILDKLINTPGSNPDEIKAVEIATNNLRDDLRADRLRQFAMATTLYVILGAFFAAMLAKDILQALAIGAGWTAYLGSLGLKKEYAARKDIKDKTTEDLETALSQATKGTGNGYNFKDLRMDAAVSRAI